MNPGDRVKLKEGSPMYEHGLRSGVIVSMHETLGRLSDRRSRELKLPADTLREVFLAGVGESGMDAVYPVIALDAVATIPAMPQGFEVPCTARQMEPA